MFARTIALLSVPILLTALTPPSLAGEDPADGRCDPTSYLVCARAGAGANGECVLEGAIASCTWSRGYIYDAFSRLVVLPGDAEAFGATSLEVCISGDCFTELGDFVLPDCSWLPAMECGADDREDGSVGPIELAMGQCLLVTTTISITAQAWTISKSVPIASAEFTDTSEGAGQVCLVDDGRD